jgi:hypothetical protein
MKAVALLLTLLGMGVQAMRPEPQAIKTQQVPWPFIFQQVLPCFYFYFYFLF